MVTTKITTLHYIDQVTQERYELDEIRWQSNHANPLSVCSLDGIVEAEIDKENRSIWRYSGSLPLKIDQPVSLGEGCTPLIRYRGENGNCFLKLEWFSPTGSFKDRGASVMLSLLNQLKVRQIVADSSGNAGCAIAAYGAAIGIGVKILVPIGTQPSKITQIRAYGADVEVVPGSREECEKEAIRQSRQIFYASHNWHPFFLQGTKSLGYEIWEDLNFTVPDNIVIPTGAGSNVLGCFLAFCELIRSGEIKKLPRIFCAQPENCAPIHKSFQAGVNHQIGEESLPTIAEGAAIKSPVRFAEVLDALKKSDGGTVGVSEGQILQSLKELCSKGIYVEPTSALSLAAYQLLKSAGTVNDNQKTVVILTGSGLKASQYMSTVFT
jgi:threonine synthase